MLRRAQIKMSLDLASVPSQVPHDKESVVVPISPSLQRLLLPPDAAVEQKARLPHAAAAHSPGS